MVKIPPPAWTIIFIALAAVASALYDFRRIIDLMVWPLGLVLALGGLTLATWAALLFRRERTELQPTSAANAKLVIAGPFTFTRNPMYLGLVLLSLGVAFWVGALPMFAVPVLVLAVANFVHIPFEEAKMARQFGEAYADYRRKVRRWV
jgi:protein-S-isoprenylcysteine O-methyltransferase Ste14